MEISMRDLFPACVDVLDREKRPIHYSELTETAMRERLGIVAPKRRDGFTKNAENVREKLLMAGQRGTFYTGDPLYAGALRSWFYSDAQIELVVDSITIPGSAEAGAAGAFEVLMRDPYMVIHNPSLANTERLNKTRSRGMVLEKHVSMWFQRNFPEFYEEAGNFENWSRPCSYDFALTIDGRMYLIDVAGPDQYGLFGKRGSKKPTDIHLMCRILGDNCALEGVVRGNGYRASIDPGSIFSPTAFVVWLNCAKHGIDYSAAQPKHDGQRAA